MICFDLDDTLFEEYDFCRSAYEEVASRLSDRYDYDFGYVAPLMYEAVVRRDNPFDLLDTELKAKGINDDSVIREMVEVYRAHAPEKLPLPEPSARTLRVLKNRGVKLGLITDGRSLTQRNKIKALGVEDYFEPSDILISEECGADKRSPDMFRRIMEAHPEEKIFIYVGDNTSKDFEQANALGWLTVCLRRHTPGVHPQDFTRPLPEAPRRIITQLPELLLPL